MHITSAERELREALYALNRAISRFVDADRFALADTARVIRDDLWELLASVEPTAKD